jgi:hypothetical protein
MAKTDDTSKARPGRNPASTPSRGSAANNPPADPKLKSDSDLIEAIEEERARLMQAESLLHCVLIAMDDDSEARGPYYPNLIELIRVLVNQSIGALDSVRLRPMIEQMKGDKPYPIPEERLGLGVGDDSVKDGGRVFYLS